MLSKIMQKKRLPLGSLPIIRIILFFQDYQ